MKDFRDRVCVITGAGSGIGQALALDLAGRAARLAVSDINAEAVGATASECTARGAEVESYALDVASREAVYDHAAAVAERFGRVNLVINNAGVALVGDVVDTSIEDYEWIMGINFWGVVYGSKAFLPHLIGSGEGHLVNISSVFGIFSVPGQSGYNAAKFAVRGFTEALRQELLLAAHPVGVTCVHPGGVRTGIAAAARTDSEISARELDEAFKRIARTTPAKAARTILRGVERERARVLVGPDAQALDLMARVLGSRYQGLVWRAAKRLDPTAQPARR
jgi:NAD(P)-dependent dehydrogenase (short-subunit alcohol dehydrogenase family)